MKEYIYNYIVNKISAETEFDLYNLIDDVYLNIKQDDLLDFYLDSEKWCNSTKITVNYRIYSYVYKNLKFKEIANMLAENTLIETGAFIGANVEIQKGLKLINFGGNSKIIGDIKIGENFLVENGCLIVSETDSKSNKIRIGNNVSIKNNASIWGNITIGDNVEISSNCVVQENIDSDSVVEIVCSIQVKLNKVQNKLPSQCLKVYGVVPKFKNQLVIYGEGFYNPSILLKIKNTPKSIISSISYWDKNTIILKLEGNSKLEKSVVDKNKIIIKSKGNKIVVINSLGLHKALVDY